MRSGSWTAAVAVAAALTGCATGSGSSVLEEERHLADWPRASIGVATDDEIHEVEVLVAATPERRQRGLQGVERLPDGEGMLFVFDRDRASGFWMKDTLVPLEIAFASHEGHIVEILSMEPCEADPCAVYRPGASYRVALEVGEGWLTERDIAPGDRLELDADEIPDAR